MATEPLASLLVVGLMVVVLAASWAAIRHARRTDREAILQARTEQAARTKGTVAVEDPTPDDDIMAVADAVAEPVCTCPWNENPLNEPRGHHVSCPVLTEKHDPYDSCGIEGHVEPKPTLQPAITLREEVLMAPQPAVLALRVMVGAHEVCMQCRDARRDAHWGLICRLCRPILAGVSDPRRAS